MTVETPQNVSSSSPVTDASKETPVNKPSPAQDLRDIQGLLVNGIFPGQVAPAVVKAYQLLEHMAKAIEAQNVTPKEVVKE